MPNCMKQDEVIFKIAEVCKNFAVFYLVDIDEVPDFNKMYELYDPVTIMFFFRNKHMRIGATLEVISKAASQEWNCHMTSAGNCWNLLWKAPDGIHMIETADLSLMIYLPENWDHSEDEE
jgi:Mitosis protein DIM1